MRNDPNFRLACQALIAMILVLSIQNIYHFERSYWAVFASMILFSQTLGASIKKSFERVIMTLVGGSLATLLYYIIPNETILIVIILLCSVFFQVCFLQRFYLGSAFFASVFIVFFFALIQSWSFHLLIVRILETILGAAITLLCSFFIFPIKAENTLLTKISLFIEQTDALVSDVLTALTTNEKNKKLMLKRANHCLLLLSELDQEYISLGYEVGHRHSRQEMKRVLLALSHFYHYLSSMVSWLTHLQDRILFLEFKNEFRTLMYLTIENLNVINTNLMKEIPLQEHMEFTAEYARLEEKISAVCKNTQYARQTWLDLFTFCYLLKNMNDSLQLAVEKKSNH